MRLHQHLRRENGRHTDDWLITYADTITLLLCLFVIILAMRSGEKSSPRDVVASLAHAPSSVEIFAARSPVVPFVQAIVPIADDTPAVGQPLATSWRDPPPGADNPPGRVGDEIEPLASPTPRIPLAAALATPTPVQEPAASPDIPPVSPPPAAGRLQSLGGDVVEQRGDRITSLRINSAAFFSSGNATISNAGNSILREVAVTLKSSAFAAYHITIEGHTDDTPISTGLFQSNWELSTARAAAVVRFLLEQGISPRKLSAAGYADTFPLAPNRGADGAVIPENQAMNRRVVVKLEKIDKAEQ